jgi:uncharacterized protein (TIGR03066 family)
MRHSRIFGVLFLSLFITACGGSSAKDLIVGKWSAKEKAPGTDKELEMVVEFTKDGKMIIDMAGLMKLEGSYKVIDDKTLEVMMKTPDGKEKTEKGAFSVTADKLTMKDPGGKETTFTRKK